VNDFQLVLLVGAVLSGVCLSSTAMASLWSKAMYPSTFDRDTVYSLAKIFFGDGGVLFVLFLGIKFL
jgi:hypothetical protein